MRKRPRVGVVQRIGADLAPDISLHDPRATGTEV